MDSTQELKSDYKKIEVQYLIMFKGSDDPCDSHVPIIRTKYLAKALGLDAHLFDPDLEAILPAVNYVMHLPRSGFDVMEMPSEVAIYTYDHPHDILVFPSSMAELLPVNPQRYTILIYADDCEIESNFFRSCDCIDIVPVSKLSSALLNDHWKKISHLMKPLGEYECLPSTLKLLNEEKLLALSLLFLLNQFGHSQSLYNLKSSGLELFKNIYDLSFRFSCSVNVIHEKSRNPDADIEAVKQKWNKSTQIPIVVSMVGRPTYQNRFAKGKLTVTETEREACRTIALHRACAKNGVVIELEDATSEMFATLAELEDHCKSRQINNRYVWSALQKIGRLFTNHIGREKLHCIARASHITAFTDFPLGLAIMPGCTAPLCCYKPISYRPITPMTRAFQREMPKAPQCYFGQHCKIVVAECLDRNDHIRPVSERLWKQCAQMNNEQIGMDMIFEEVSSIAGLKQLLADHIDADILLISAHGDYEKTANLAGLCIGDEIWYADDNDIRLPPFVMLSACHVNPRGTGAVSVTDLLLRAGALAVLGTFIPVEVSRNATLYQRLFVYIREAMEGGKLNQTILDAWMFVVATNAVNEIVSGNKSLQLWFASPNKNGIIRTEDFMLKRSAGRLHGANIYDETVSILREMAVDDGLGDYFDSVIRSQGFFPESLFYQMIGSPENIFLYHPVIDIKKNS